MRSHARSCTDHISEGKAIAISFQTEAELMVQREAQGWDLTKLMTQMSNYEIVPFSDDLRGCYITLRL